MANENRYIPDKGRIKNCFAYRGNECMVLKELYCMTEAYQCPFYKTRAEYKKGIKDGWAELKPTLERGVVNE